MCLSGRSPVARHTDQLDRYVDFEFKHLPLFREAVEDVTIESETLVAGPPTPEQPTTVPTDDRFDADDLPEFDGDATGGR